MCKINYINMTEFNCFLCNTTELSPCISSWCRNKDKGCKYNITSCYKCSKHINYNIDDHLNYSCEYSDKNKKELEKSIEEHQSEQTSFSDLQQENKELKNRINELEARIKELEEKLETSQLTTQIETSPYQNK